MTDLPKMGQRPVVDESTTEEPKPFLQEVLRLRQRNVREAVGELQCMDSPKRNSVDPREITFGKARDNERVRQIS